MSLCHVKRLSLFFFFFKKSDKCSERKRSDNNDGVMIKRQIRRRFTRTTRLDFELFAGKHSYVNPLHGFILFTHSYGTNNRVFIYSLDQWFSNFFFDQGTLCPSQNFQGTLRPFFFFIVYVISCTDLKLRTKPMSITHFHIAH